ncbi:MAG: CRISPR-associated endonuclease Cas2 [Desulfovibrionaceae bacterium]
MRLIVFFDLPVKSKAERREATRFRKYLLKDGYDMLQLSVYARICRGQEAVDKHYGRLMCQLPPTGCVRVLQVTEQQYGRMKIVVGKAQPAEKVAPVQLLLL